MVVYDGVGGRRGTGPAETLELHGGGRGPGRAGLPGRGRGPRSGKRAADRGERRLVALVRLPAGHGPLARPTAEDHRREHVAHAALALLGAAGALTVLLQAQDERVRGTGLLPVGVKGVTDTRRGRVGSEALEIEAG